jgi:hydrogenase maturation protease
VSPTDPARRVVVAGMGNEYRRDDGAGPAVAGRVAARLEAVVDLGPLADPLDLLGRWDDADLAVVVDAVRTGAPPGTVAVVDLDEVAGRPVAGAPVTSSHGIGLDRVLRLARAVGNGPRRVLVVGVEGDDFGDGLGLTPAVARAVDDAARRVAELIEEDR